MMARIFIFAVIAAVLFATARATEPLTEQAVLQSAAKHYPSILKSLAERDAAAGEALARRGAFDTVFSVDAFDRLSGFYDGRAVNATIRKRLPDFGASVYGGYRVSGGDFPTYEDINFTNRAGEAKLGVLFSLLRDRTIDDARYGAAIASLAVEEADFDVLLTQIGVQHRARVAYWRWVAAGRRLEIYEQLFDIANARQSGLEEEVRLGARAAIFLTENQQNITRREILKARAARDFQIAANDLGLFNRTGDGAVAIPSREQLPPPAPAETAQDNAAEVEGAIIRAQSLRPELRLIAIDLEKAAATLKLARNERKPQLDLRYEFSNDFGALGEGGPSRDGADNIVGLRFSVPFEQRKARGAIAKAEAELEAARQDRRLVNDQIEIEVRNIVMDLETSQTLASLAAREAEQADIMQDAERDRFDSGASDFFLVNLREEAAANARIQYYGARLDAEIAAANFDAATVNLERLGLNSDRGRATRRTGVPGVIFLEDSLPANP